MSLNYFKLTLILAVILPVAGHGASHRLIDNGLKADQGQFPSVVKIVAYDRANILTKKADYLCTGTLIAPDIVFTAAHCSGPLELRVSASGDSMGYTESGLLAPITVT